MVTNAFRLHIMATNIGLYRFPFATDDTSTTHHSEGGPPGLSSPQKNHKKRISSHSFDRRAAIFGDINLEDITQLFSEQIFEFRPSF